MPRRFYMHRPRKKKKASKIKNYIFIIFTVLTFLFAFTLMRLDKNVIPRVFAMSHMQTKNKVSVAINQSINKIIKEMDVTTIDFYKKNLDASGKVNSISVNSVLMNEFCANVALDISESYKTMDKEEFVLPIGSLFGIDAFANVGPKYSIALLPMGNAQVNYETKFESVGINQINFQVWLNVESVVQIVNPLSNEEITVSKKVSIVNTVVSGDVPSTYFNFDK